MAQGVGKTRERPPREIVSHVVCTFLKIYKIKIHTHIIIIIKTLSNSRFTIVSSYEDASPRVITESFMVDTPVLVYKNIIGGWKYINNETGLFYDSKNIKSKIKKILKNNYNPRNYYLNNFGLKVSGKKFRDFIVKIDPRFSNYKYLRFSVS